MPLFMVDFEQCDSKKCTGKKMERFKLLSSIRDRKKKFRGIVLSAFGKKFVSRNDLECAEKYGICVIDCSWNRIEETKEFRYKHERKLPFVVAGNPVNFGKPYQLSCVEALATALCAMDYVPQAKFIMSKFGWSDGFWKQNPNIAAYGNCQTL
jgi:pre-rRNA-processing protein TSR3